MKQVSITVPDNHELYAVACVYHAPKGQALGLKFQVGWASGLTAEDAYAIFMHTDVNPHNPSDTPLRMRAASAVCISDPDVIPFAFAQD